MKTISILVPRRAILGSLEGTRQLFTQVNDFLRAGEEAPLFKVQLIGLAKETQLAGGLYTINAELLINDVKKTDLIVIPALDGDIKNSLEINSDFIPWIINQKDHEDEPIRKAQEFIEANYWKKITVDELAEMLFLGRRNFERRFKKATANTVLEYIQRVKIEAAKMNLESSRENVNEVMYKVGYSDPKAFRATFKKISGLSPVQYRNKYQREISV